MSVGPGATTPGELAISTTCQDPCNPTQPCEICIEGTCHYKIGVEVTGPDGAVCSLPTFVDWDDQTAWGMSGDEKLVLPIAPTWITGTCEVRVETSAPAFYCDDPYPHTWRYFGVVSIEPESLTGPGCVKVTVEEVPPP